jgi:hypothetical protein
MGDKIQRSLSTWLKNLLTGEEGVQVSIPLLREQEVKERPRDHGLDEAIHAYKSAQHERRSESRKVDE